jgi:hypothetical protein
MSDKTVNQMDAYADWVHLRSQCHCLSHSILNECYRFLELPATSETNQSLTEIRDLLADLLAHIKSVRKGGGE